MIDINAQCLHGSPYQSSSHSVCSNTELRNSSSSSSSVFDRRSSVNQIKNASIIIQHRNRDFHTPSVIISNDQSHSLLNAPKPSLKISQDNILFMKKDHLIKLNCESQINANLKLLPGLVQFSTRINSSSKI
ncbi:unnamed protein product [Heterobilharzia americana]|nr:unnamed protein product [Heterobilharzia americana]